MIQINSFKYKKLFFTYIFSKNTPSKGTIILLDGLPSNPSTKANLMRELSEKGYDVFFPRYEGTWESDGTFLERAPSEGIIEFIKKLKDGINIEGKNYNNNKIFLFGASFGGGVALDISTKEDVGKICVVSPVISFKKVNGIETLEDYLIKTRSKDYRFDPRGWKKLLEDQIWNLRESKVKKPSKVWIGTGKNDDQIKEGDVRAFGKINGIRIKTYNLGHITLSKIPSSMLRQMIDFLKK
jgi:esterase/lipase